ncbi:MAG TPA: DUF2752 domain-containing protein [Phycisphaerae bacterium]|nr:DUF2752 domain-containing protein [Phycisphaerae bacterium]
MSDIPTTDSLPQVPDELTLAPPIVKPQPTPAQKRLEVRIWCALTFALCITMLGIGFWLSPKSAGTGSHEELGLPPCGFLATTGYPCPTCGCTTAVSNFSHGYLLRSFLTQPFGFAVALLAAVLVPLTLWGAVTGTWKGPSMFWLGWHWQYWVYGGLALLALGWIYKSIIIKQHITF